MAIATNIRTEQRLAELRRRARQQRLHAALALLDRSSPEDRWRLLGLVVWPDPELERRQIEQLELDDVRPPA